MAHKQLFNSAERVQVQLTVRCGSIVPPTRRLTQLANDTHAHSETELKSELANVRLACAELKVSTRDSDARRQLTTAVCGLRARMSGGVGRGRGRDAKGVDV